MSKFHVFRSAVPAAAAPVDAEGADAAHAGEQAPAAAPHAADETTLGRLRNALGRTGARLRTRKIEVSTAVYQTTLNGKPLDAATLTTGGTRYPAKPVNASNAPGTPLLKTEKQSLAALARTARRRTAQVDVADVADVATVDGLDPLDGTDAPADPQRLATAVPAAPAAPAQSGEPVPMVPLDAQAALPTAMDDPAGLLAYVSRALPSPPGDLLAAAQLSHSLAELGAADGAPSTTRGALIAQALREAGVETSAEATLVLDALRGLDLTHLDQQRSASPVEANAWRTARILARTNVGFEAFEHLRDGTAGGPAATAAPGAAASSTQLAARMMLQAADAMDAASATPSADPAPGAVAATHAPAPGVPVREAAFAWRAYAAASTLLTHGRRALTPDQKGAFFAWRQDFRADNRGSDLSRARERLNKFSAKSVARVDEPRWKSFAPRVFGKHKSPLSALSMGTQGLPHEAVGAAEADADAEAAIAAAPDRLGPNADAARATLKNVARQLQSSARLRLTDGGKVGVSTRGLSANIGHLLHAGAVPVAPRVDLRASKSREALVELSRGTQGVEMFIGTAKTRTRHVGAGALVGYDVDVGVTQLRAGVTVQGVLHSQQLDAQNGVSLRIARRLNADGDGYDDAAMRAKLDTVVDHVFDEATAAHTGDAHDTWNRLAERYFDDPDISVSWTDANADSVKRGGSADAGVAVKLGTAGSPLRAGVNLGLGYERTARQTHDSAEQSGRLQIEQHRVGAGSRLLARLSGTLGSTASVGSGQSSAGIGLLSLDAPSATVTFADDTRVAKVQLVREDGVLVHRACLLDTDYTSAETYTRALDASRPEWCALFATQIADEQRAEREQAAQNGDPAPVQRDPQTLAAERLDAHLGDVKANRRANQTYFHRYRLRRDAAAQISTLEALQKTSTGPVAEALEAKIADVLNEPASWLPIELKVKERTATTRRPGLNFGLQLNTQTAATGEREVFAQSIPFALVEELDQRGAPGPV